MEPFRSFNSTARVALGLACLLACAAPVRAQAFAEFGGGWNYPAPDPVGSGYSHGYNFRVSLGHPLTPRVRVRFDLLAGWFGGRPISVSPPCPPNGCTGAAAVAGNDVGGASLVALSANWLVDVDPRGILYGIGGAGLSDVSAGRGNDVAIDVSAGAGISVPIRAGLRAFVEARYHIPFGATAELPWIVPVTFGIRF